jgi:hypothetical protein
MKEKNRAHLQIRLPQNIKDEIDNIADQKNITAPELLRLWLEILVQGYRADEEFKTLHVAPDLSLASTNHYYENGNIQ